jgi:hypothetical protein
LQAIIVYRKGIGSETGFNHCIQAVAGVNKEQRFGIQHAVTYSAWGLRVGQDAKSLAVLDGHGPLVHSITAINAQQDRIFGCSGA